MRVPGHPIAPPEGPGQMHGGRRPVTKVLPRDTRAHNRALVLQGVLDLDRPSRADLARSTGLTRVTVSELVADLVGDQVLTEVALPPERIGRAGKPATALDLDPRGPLLLALDLSRPDRAVLGLSDLRGAVLQRAVTAVPTGTDAAVEAVADGARALVAGSPRPVLAVGAGVPGVVDDTGSVTHALRPPWSGVHLGARLGSLLGLRVHVANDANLAALGEATFGAGDEHGLVVVTIGLGVGGGVLLDGRVLRGPRSSAGEVGHVVVDPLGARCACGNRGCLETVLAEGALRARPGAGARHRAGAHLGVVLGPVVTLLGLTDVVLHGDPDLLQGPLLAGVQEALADLVLPLVAAAVRVRVVDGATDLVLAGAVAHARHAELGVA